MNGNNNNAGTDIAGLDGRGGNISYSLSNIPSGYLYTSLDNCILFLVDARKRSLARHHGQI